MHTTRTHPLQYRQNDFDSPPKADVSSRFFRFGNKPRAALNTSPWRVKGPAQKLGVGPIHPKPKCTTYEYTSPLTLFLMEWGEASPPLHCLRGGYNFHNDSTHAKVWGNCFPLLHDANVARHGSEWSTVSILHSHLMTQMVKLMQFL